MPSKHYCRCTPVKLTASTLTRPITPATNEKLSIYKKQRPALGDLPSKKPKTFFYRPEYSSGNGTAQLKKLLGDKVFSNPKPIDLIKDFMTIAIKKDGFVLDSFAGSGTTAHAILALNKEDGGKRKFILVECGDYADSITAERVRRVIKGVKTAKDENLKKGLGGEFTYCNLGEAIDIDKLLTGTNLPSFIALGSLLFHTATHEVIDPAQIDEPSYYLGASSAYHLWMIYKPELAFLQSNEAALTLDKAKAIVKAKRGKKRHLVFAPATFVSSKRLTVANNGKGLAVDYQPLPWALYRVYTS